MDGLGFVDRGADIDWSTVPDRLIPARKIGDQVTKARHRSRFVKGPLCFDWIVAAHSLGNNTLPVLLALKSKSDSTREAWVKPPAAMLLALGIDRMARSRAIQALERGGLVEVQRRKGRPPLVRLLPWEGGQDG